MCGVACSRSHTEAFTKCHSLVRHLDVRFLAAVLVHTLVSSVDVHAVLRLRALVFSRFTFVYI